MKLEDELEAKVAVMRMELALFVSPDNNMPPSINKTDPPSWHCVLSSVTVKGINMRYVKNSSGPINYHVMGVFLLIVHNTLVPQLIQTRNPKSFV